MENWKKRLKEMKLRHLKEIRPDFYALSGSERMRLKPYRDDTANGLTAAVADWITYSGGSATRVNTTGSVRIVRGVARWTNGTTRRGTADLHCVVRGKHLSLEIKIGPDKMSEAQYKEKERIERAGGIYYVVTSMPAFIQWFEETFDLINNSEKTAKK